jgi:hypothetical protein
VFASAAAVVLSVLLTAVSVCSALAESVLSSCSNSTNRSGSVSSSICRWIAAICLSRPCFFRTNSWICFCCCQMTMPSAATTTNAAPPTMATTLTQRLRVVDLVCTFTFFKVFAMISIVLPEL